MTSIERENKIEPPASIDRDLLAGQISDTSTVSQALVFDQETLLRPAAPASLLLRE